MPQHLVVNMHILDCSNFINKCILIVIMSVIAELSHYILKYHKQVPQEQAPCVLSYLI